VIGGARSLLAAFQPFSRSSRRINCLIHMMCNYRGCHPDVGSLSAYRSWSPLDRQDDHFKRQGPDHGQRTSDYYSQPVQKRHAPATFPFTAREAPSDAAVENRPLGFLHHEPPNQGCASFRVIQSFHLICLAHQEPVWIHLPRALSGPKLAMFQVSGDARINHVGLAEGLRWRRQSERRNLQIIRRRSCSRKDSRC
jgi:hypothetical protein